MVKLSPTGAIAGGASDDKAVLEKQAKKHRKEAGMTNDEIPKDK
jgi:hypothetical protein